MRDIQFHVMSRQSPIKKLHQEAEATSLTYGPSEHPDGPVEVVESYGELELEYGALRRSCVIVDCPHRAVVAVMGKDRIEFLNRMVTQELKGLAPFRVRRSFWLNGKGRIDADLRIIDLPSRTLLEVDVHCAERTIEGLSKYVITEDVTLEDWTANTHRLSLHGNTAMELVTALAMNTHGAEASGPAMDELHPDRACVVRLFDVEVVLYREDTCGVPGLELVVPTKHALMIYQRLLEAGHDHHHEDMGSQLTPNANALGRKVNLRPAGWHAFNIARIEAGTPIYNLDFGDQSLPAETGVLQDRVSFKKGCYLGQEIVARMHARGHPKQCLVPVKFERIDDPATGLYKQPVTGAVLTVAGATDPIGQVTSSALAPMLSSTPIAFAQVRWAHITPGTVLETVVEGTKVKGVVQPQLNFALVQRAK